MKVCYHSRWPFRWVFRVNPVRFAAGRTIVGRRPRSVPDRAQPAADRSIYGDRSPIVVRSAFAGRALLGRRSEFSSGDRVGGLKQLREETSRHQHPLLILSGNHRYQF